MQGGGRGTDADFRGDLISDVSSFHLSLNQRKENSDKPPKNRPFAHAFGPPRRFPELQSRGDASQEEAPRGAEAAGPQPAGGQQGHGAELPEEPSHRGQHHREGGHPQHGHRAGDWAGHWQPDDQAAAAGQEGGGHREGPEDGQGGAEAGARHGVPAESAGAAGRCAQGGALALLQHPRGEHPLQHLLPAALQAAVAGELLPLRRHHVPGRVRAAPHCLGRGRPVVPPLGQHAAGSEGGQSAQGGAQQFPTGAQGGLPGRANHSAESQARRQLRRVGRAGAAAFPPEAPHRPVAAHVEAGSPHAHGELPDDQGTAWGGRNGRDAGGGSEGCQRRRRRSPAEARQSPIRVGAL
eukprot:scaffold529_cov308-Pinguiococcus_pyrenoidosus.AAC.90